MLHATLTPTPITYNTGITFTSSAKTHLDVAKNTYSSLSVSKMTEYGTISALSIFTGTSAADQTMTLNYYH